ncbi:hypothetical protein PLESTF_000524800 [Pleodorina starrii]|nr:hypothetical protein PLESTF_000524800 [Pleodorina starrii]
MPRALILAIGRTAGRPIRFCSSSFCNFSITVLKGIARMLHVKAPVRGLGWVHRGTQARTATLNRVSSSHVHELAPDVEAVIRNIHSNATKAVVYATGGAVQSISWLLAVPGASATVLEAAVPYARDSLVSILGQEPEQFCSAATAAAMAETAYRRAADLSPFGSSVVGLGATCSLATVDVKRGDHRAYVAVHSGGGSRCMALTLAKGARSRVGEDDLVSRLLVKMLADASGADSTPLQLPLISPDATAAAAPSPPTPDPAAVASTNASSTASPRGSAPAAAVSAVQPCDVLHDTWRAAADPVQRLLRGEVRCVEFCGREVTVDAPRRGRGRVYLPGSFNPLHEGSCWRRRCARRQPPARGVALWRAPSS